MLARRFALALAAGTLTACGAAATGPHPAAHSAAERQWLANAASLVETLEADVALAANGGDNVATARHALGDQSILSSLLVAYILFGGCRHEVANVGVPSDRARSVVTALTAACARLERASALFERAVKDESAAVLLQATRLAVASEPLLFRARERPLRGLARVTYRIPEHDRATSTTSCRRSRSGTACWRGRFTATG